MSADARAGLAARAAAWLGLARLVTRVAVGSVRHRTRRQSVAERLAALPRSGLPVEGPVEIDWDDHLVPCIAARSDRDLAVALGLVHAHLRLAQMEMMRRIAQGRLAEAVGAVAVPLDHTLRALDPTRAVPAILAALSDATREWLEGYVAGINHHLASPVAPPLEFRLLGITAAPWTAADVLSIVRLAAADVNWLVWTRLLRHHGEPDWPQIWARLVADGTVALVGPAAPGEGALEDLVPSSGHAGSNAVAVAGRRSATGQPWVAGDPHLSVGVPSVWLAASYRSPSYRVAGLMAPGVPAMMIGRNPFLAWGGTNLHAASSELFDVSELPAGAIVETRVRLPVRWSRPREIVLRDTDYGPIVSDAPLFPGPAGKMLALRWIGHEPSDEIGALLAINRARDAAEFRRAAESIAVPGQNLVFADAAGHIGRVSAVSLPMRPAGTPADLVSPTAAMAVWASRADAGDFPADIDPPQGFVASANDRPPDGDVPIGWLFSPRDRVERLNALLWASERIGIDGLAALQRDAAAPAMLALCDRLCALLDPPSRHGPVYDALAGWDGAYEPESAGALALELVLAHLVSTAIPPHRRAIYGAVWHARKLLTEEIDRQPPPQLKASLETALAAARPALRRLRDWGGAHRLRLAHPLGALPLIGRRHCHIDWPWPGSNDTVLKSAHGLVRKRHAVSFGSNARYIFDLADPDANRLVILGGQDGAPGSAAFLDQAELFRRGEYLTVPIDPGAMAAQFRHRTVLEP